MKQLSGWARLWIVCAIAIWAVGYWHVSQSYYSPLALIERIIQRDSSPPTTDNVTRGVVCLNATFSDEDFNVCMSDQARFEQAKDRVNADERNYENRLLMRLLAYLLAPFALALVWLIGRWIWRGFRVREGAPTIGGES